MRFVILSFLYRYRYLGDGDTDQREILHDGTYKYKHFLLPFGGDTPRDSKNPKFRGEVLDI